MKLRRRKAGFTLLEALVTVTIMAVLLGILTLLFLRTGDVFRTTSSKDSAVRDLRKARVALERDLALTSPAQVRRTTVPPSLGGGNDGEALWFLSPVDPATGVIVRKQDGHPFWQRNILYYLVVPNNHDATFGQSCAGGVGPNGFDDRCPHKVLIRKVIDSGPPTSPPDETTEEVLLPAVAGYLDRPNGFDVSGLGGAGLQQSKIVAQLLHFSSALAPLPQNAANQLVVDVRGVSIGEARRTARVGTDSFFDSAFTHQSPFSVLLHN